MKISYLFLIGILIFFQHFSIAQYQITENQVLEKQATMSKDLRIKDINNNINLLLTIPDKYGLNTNLNLDDLLEYGFDITTAGMQWQIAACPWSAQYLGAKPFDVDTLLTDINCMTNYNAFFIENANWWSGIAYGDLYNSPEAIARITNASDSGLAMWATCAGVRVFAKADIIDGVDVTGKINFQNEYIAAGANYLGPDILPLVDSNIITSTRGMYFHSENNEALLTYYAKHNIGTGEMFEKDIVCSINYNTSNYNWESLINNGINSGGTALVYINDEFFITAGYTYSNTFGYSDICLTKSDANGNLIWTKIIGGSGFDFAYDIIKTDDNCLLITGLTTSGSSGSVDMIILKTDLEANLIWSEIIGGDALDVGRSLVEIPGNEFLILGYTVSFGEGFDDFYLVRIDSDGNLIWEKTYGSFESEQGKMLKKSLDGNILLLGSTGSYTFGNRDIYLLKTDFEGNVLWENHYGNSNYQDAFDLCEDPNKNIYIAGHSDLHQVDPLDIYVVKLDSTGEQQWDNRYETNNAYYDYGKSILYSQDASLIISGNSRDKNNEVDAFVMKTDLDGLMIWEELIDQPGHQWITDVCFDKDGNIVLSGHNYYQNGKHCDVWLLNIENTMVSVEGNNSGNEIKLDMYPNPAHDFINIDIAEIHSLQFIDIFDMTGKKIESKENSQGENIITLDISEYNQGLYLIHIYNKWGLNVGKFLKL